MQGVCKLHSETNMTEKENAFTVEQRAYTKYVRCYDIRQLTLNMICIKCMACLPYAGLVMCGARCSL